jgi:hypothetical protein
LQQVSGFAVVQANGLDVGLNPLQAQPSIFCGVLATRNRLCVALLTLTSVAWADSSTAVSSSNTLLYLSSVCGCGLAAARVAKKCSIALAFMISISS